MMIEIKIKVWGRDRLERSIRSIRYFSRAMKIFLILIGAGYECYFNLEKKKKDKHLSTVRTVCFAAGAW